MNFAITPANSSDISVSTYLPVEWQGRACWQRLSLGKEIEQLGDQEGGWIFITCLWYSVQFSSVTQSCTTLCDPMDCSKPGFPIHHQLPEFTQTHVHWVGDATKPSHPLSSPSPPTSNLSQHQGLFKWVISLHQVVKVLAFQLQHQSFRWIFRTDLQDGLVGSPCSPRDSQESPTAQFKSINSSVLSFLLICLVQLSHPYMTTRKTKALTRQTFVGKVMFLLFNMLSRLIFTYYLLKISLKN